MKLERFDCTYQTWDSASLSADRDYRPDGEYVEWEAAFLLSAEAFSTAAHAGQYRKHSELPYIVHPIAVAQLMKDTMSCVRVEMLAAALLHDVAEDTKVSIDTIRKFFGDDVGDLVQGLTKASYSGNRQYRFTNEVMRLSKCSDDVKTIKIADSICNIRDYLNDQPKYAYEVYMPEKRILLDTALKEGDTKLWNLCDSILKENMK